MLFTFPSRYWFAIGLTGVFSLAGWARRIQAGLHVSRPTQESALPRRASRKGLSPAAARLSRRFRSRSECNPCGPTTPAARRHTAGLGCSPVARRYWGNHSYFPFLRVLRCFSSPGWPSPKSRGVAVLQTAGLSHSDIRGSKVICTYPRLVAACHVLHRLCEPRHPPSALNYFQCRTYFRLSHAASAIKAEGSKSSTSFSLQSCLCQYVKDLLKGGRRMGEE